MRRNQIVTSSIEVKRADKDFEIAVIQGNKTTIMYYGDEGKVLVIAINDIVIDRIHEKDSDIEKLFTQWAGITTNTAWRTYNRMMNPKRCKHCNSKRLSWMRGFPGETVLVCLDCNKMLACEFDRSYVM